MAGLQLPAPVQPGDSYLLVNDRDQDMEAYDHSGQLLWTIPCLARGQGTEIWIPDRPGRRLTVRHFYCLRNRHTMT